MLCRPVGAVIEWRGGVRVKERVEAVRQDVVFWKREELKKTLGGEEVLTISLSWPEVSGKTLRGANRYYGRLRDGWKRQWEGDLYIRACVDLSERRVQSRSFTPWRAELCGQILLENESLLSISMEAREVRGEGRTLLCRWGDTWRLEDGMPVGLRELYPRGKTWKKQLWQDISAALEECRGIDLYPITRNTWKKCLVPGRFGVTEDQILLFVPQGAIAPEEYGVVELALPRPEA